MKVLVTGANGFLGKNLITFLSLNKDIEIFKYDKNNSLQELDRYTKECDFVYHLAGVNRPENNSEFMEGNFGFTEVLLNSLIKNNNKAPVMISSSIQAELDNDYGKSKKAGEDIVINYGLDNNVKTYIYRFPNLFGKWSRPNYNSVIATWCHNVSHDLDILIDNPDKVITLAYVDDVCKELIKCLKDDATKMDNYCFVPVTYTYKLGYIASLIKSFKDNSNSIMVPSTGDEFTKKLYATYISFVNPADLVVDLDEHRDDRGLFCELVRTRECGQISISTTLPNVVRGGHYHNTKMERFIVIKGIARIVFEQVLTHEKFDFVVSGDKLQYVNIPVGYQHSINNIGDDELVMVLWANELFDPNEADTYVMEDNYA